MVARLGRHEARPALDALAHRGIRSSVVQGSWGYVAHVRLPIVGLDRDYDQPVSFGSWVLGFVGEILDFRDQDTGLESDVPLVAHLWETDPLLLGQRDGFWAIAAIDRSRGQLHLLCDYLAQKPLYYREDLCAAASELVPLLQMGMTTLDKVYLADAMKWGYCPDSRRTPYEQIKRVPPGGHVIIQEGYAARVELVDPLLPAAASPEGLKEEIELAVRRRVVASDVPVAALVSGGLDSAITYTLASRYGEVEAFHVENGERESAELVLQGNPCRWLGSDAPTLAEGLAYMQEPIDLGSLLPQVSLARAVAGTNVCLTGDGADEFFGGYGRASRYDSQASDVWRELIAWHLPRLDRVMMRHQIEVRSPFLARRVAAGALALPWEPHRIDKQILRDLFRADLPRGVADTPKRPLRTAAVESGREDQTRQLIALLTAQHKQEQMRWLQ